LRKNIGLKIKRKFHISAARAPTEVLPFLRIIFKNDVHKAVGISKWLDLDEEMIEYIVGNKAKAGQITAFLH
jgi:hypothetical protein